MTRRANDIETIPRQAHTKCFYKRAGREFGRHEHIAKYAYALSGNDCLDCMQLLPEAQMVHVLEIGHIAPLASRDSKPPLPGWSAEIGRWPIAVNEDVSPKVSNSLQASGRGKQWIADW